MMDWFVIASTLACLAIGIMDLSRCCCGGECECCSGAQPTSLAFVIDGISGSDNCCIQLEGFFPGIATSGVCTWSGTIVDLCSCDAVYNLHIDAEIVDSGGGNCDFTVTIQLRDTALSPAVFEIVAHYEAASPIDCCSWEDLALTIVSFTNLGNCDCGEDGLSVTVSATCD